MDEPLEVMEIRRHGVGHSPLEIAPDELIWVEFGCVTREAMEAQSRRCAQEIADENASVLVDVVPDDEYWAAQTLEQQAQESNDIRRPDVPVAQKPGVKRDVLSFGLNADSRDRGDIGPPASATQNGSLSAGRPGPGDWRNQQEAALVNEDEMGASLFGFFL